ncbi:hypothetical protein T4B_9302 [Trichinella pseudospiralis]|uniref:Uncharacterized protein n=1 Tax=Trichinella pseudospiralis TaxID=6337 RepID=A0A0V1IAD5_TRIPS|nr:hypothetical protein T4B_9302 [Trichinella pseudospiralis]
MYRFPFCVSSRGPTMSKPTSWKGYPTGWICMGAWGFFVGTARADTSGMPSTSPRRLPVAGASSIAGVALAASFYPVGPRLPVGDGGQDLRDPLSQDDLQQPCLARIRGLPLPAYGPLGHDYPVAL